MLSENEGYNYIQMLVYSASGSNHTVVSGGSTFNSDFNFGMRGFITL
jgi:hypothetical protein